VARGRRPGLAPSSDDAALLELLLGNGPRARAGWQRWIEAVGDPIAAWRATGSPARRHSVLFHEAIGRHDVPIDDELVTQVRFSVTRERARQRIVDEVVAEAVAALAATRVVVVGGIALSHTAYPEPAARHAHDLDLLALPGDHAAGASILRGLGWTLADDVWMHPTGLPASLHGSVLDRLGSRGVAGLVERAGEAVVAGERALVLDPADALVRALARAGTPAAHRSSTWVIDASHLLAGTVDTSDLDRRAADLGVAGVVALALRWLERSGTAALDPSLRRRVARRATTASPAATAVAGREVWRRR
jgi:hypothetical protein